MNSTWIIAWLYIAGFISCTVLEFDPPSRSPKWIKWVLVIGLPLCVMIAAAAGLCRGFVRSLRP
ncbi:hypothetical protein F9L06_10120 [Brucella anthropi]|uniref:Uncharacterized protein n=1 Tax=Brucella anthropi TaxID=529 RepID=A0A6I0DSU2_BRUAN|nr:hypothetical protein [Brucella anthropi]KAB2798950.1 hypothetical protein F9L06_10120 [Brucella anthropi]